MAYHWRGTQFVAFEAGVKVSKITIYYSGNLLVIKSLSICKNYSMPMYLLTAVQSLVSISLLQSCPAGSADFYQFQVSKFEPFVLSHVTLLGYNEFVLSVTWLQCLLNSIETESGYVWSIHLCPPSQLTTRVIHLRSAVWSRSQSRQTFSGVRTDLLLSNKCRGKQLYKCDGSCPYILNCIKAYF